MKEKVVPHWNGLWNFTFEYIYNKFGEDALIQYYKNLADSPYYKKAIKSIKKKGLQGIKEYWEESSEREGTKYTDEIKDDKYDLKIENCSAYQYFKKENLKNCDMYCDYCKIINSEICKKAGLKYKLIDWDKNGKCHHLFYKEEE